MAILTANRGPWAKVNIMYWMFALFKNLYIEILTPNAILGSGAFGRWLDHKNGALKNGISALIKETLESFLAPSAKQELRKKKSVVMNQKLALMVHGICLHLDLGLHSPQTYDK